MNWLVGAQVVGGAVLFLLGMQWLSAALRAAAGARMRTLLTTATRSHWRGLALGTTTGFLAHSSAATVMTVGFVNAGLLGLAASLPVLFGANVGTTLSMQLISFRLTDYAFAAVAVGGALYLARRAGRGRTLGQAVLGFGLLFLGMKLSGEAIEPYRESLAPWLARIDGSTAGGMAVGVVSAALVTAIVQSSGAVIGMTFVLAGSGAFSSLWQTYPIVLGAHVGTTLTGVIASLGTSPDARRAAIANVVFNLGNATLGAFAAGGLVPLLERTTTHLVHQTANAHTTVMAIAAALALPWSGPLAALLRRVVRLGGAESAPSHLAPELRAKPEQALRATLRELGRCTALCVESFRLVDAAVARASRERRWLRRVQRNEHSIDEIKTSVRSYLAALTEQALAPRQAVFAQLLNRCMIEIERIGDHIDRLADWIAAHNRHDEPPFDAETTTEIGRLAQHARLVVERLALAFASDDPGFDAPSWDILDARNTYQRECVPVKAAVTERLSRREVPPAQALAFSEMAAAFDRIVRHCAVIAQEMRQPAFALDRTPLPAAKQ